MRVSSSSPSAPLAVTLLCLLGSVVAAPNSTRPAVPDAVAPARASGAAASASAATKAGTAALSGFTPLIRKRFTWPYDGPDKVDTFTGGRGPQTGDNICGHVTGQYNTSSLCITSHINDISDWCLWAPPKPNSTIADTEGEEVAWCTKPGFGTRSIPPGALSGVQLFVRVHAATTDSRSLKTPRYAIIAGFIDQTQVNIQDGDFGGELDPHGADQRGNPIGSLMFSTAFSTNGSYQQIVEWNSYIGSGRFCQKICSPSSTSASSDCQHIYDRLGCDYVMPMSYSSIKGSYTSCNADTVLAPGLYLGPNNTTLTYTQPPESVAITSLPYTPTIPASSQCTTFTSAALFSALGTNAAAASASVPLPTGVVAPANVAAASASASSTPPSPVKGAASGAPAFGFASALIAALSLIATLA